MIHWVIDLVSAIRYQKSVNTFKIDGILWTICSLLCPPSNIFFSALDGVSSVEFNCFNVWLSLARKREKRRRKERRDEWTVVLYILYCSTFRDSRSRNLPNFFLPFFLDQEIWLIQVKSALSQLYRGLGYTVGWDNPIIISDWDYCGIGFDSSLHSTALLLDSKEVRGQWIKYSC